MINGGGMEYQEKEDEDDDDDFEDGKRKKRGTLYDPLLLEELEDVYHDAHDHLVLSFTNTLLQKPQQ
jgi:hypothetical protein